MQSLTYGLKPVPFKDWSARAYFNRLLVLLCYKLDTSGLIRLAEKIVG